MVQRGKCFDVTREVSRFWEGEEEDLGYELAGNIEEEEEGHV